MTLPNLIIPGAQKSASTTLYQLLNEHEEIYGGDVKEPHFFSRDGNYRKGISCYQQNYLRHQGEKIVVDASQSYMPLDFVPHRICSTLGTNVRFVFVLRHPIERVISAFTHQKKRPKRETKRELSELVPPNLDTLTLEELLAYEINAIQKGIESGSIQPHDRFWARHGFPYRYFYDSCYTRHIKNYYRYFPRQNFLFLTFRDVTLYQKQTLIKIARFLRVDADKFEQSTGTLHANQAWMYKKHWMTRIVPAIKWCLLRPILPESKMDLFEKWEMRQLKYKPQYSFPNTIHRRLMAIFQPEIKRTMSLTGLDLSFWQ